MFRIPLSAFFIFAFSVSSSFASEKKKIDENLAQHKSRFEQLELFNKVLHLVETQYYRQVDMEKLIVINF
jgi:hypothetical protein